MIKACAVFVSYIAKEQRDQLRFVLGNVKFFSIQADGSKDAGTVEDEQAVHCLVFGSSRESPCS